MYSTIWRFGVVLEDGGTSMTYSPLCPVASVEVAIADSFGQMVGGDVWRAGEVGYCPRHFENTGVGAGRQGESLHSHAEQFQTLGVGLGKPVNHPFGHLCIAVHFFVIFESFGLYRTGGNDAFADVGTWLAGRCLTDVFERKGGYLALQVDAV